MEIFTRMLLERSDFYTGSMSDSKFFNIFTIVKNNQVMCQAYKSRMTQKQGYVWLLPGWYKDDWYDVDGLKLKKSKIDNLARKVVSRNRSVFLIN